MSESIKHVRNTPKNSAQTLQESLAESAVNKASEIEAGERLKEFELDLVRSLSRHRIPFEFMDCLSVILKKHCGDEIIQKMKLRP